MKKEDLIIIHKLTKQIEDRAKEIQSIMNRKDTIDENIFEHDYRKKVLEIHVCIDRLETINDYYYKVHK